MPDHLIHLRRAWSAEGPSPSRVDLPILWGRGPIPDRIARSFRAPRIDPARESVWLRFEAISGVRLAALNGEDLGPVARGGVPWEVLVASLRPSGNRLELVLDVPEVPRSSIWGLVALVIRTQTTPGPQATSRDVGDLGSFGL